VIRNAIEFCRVTHASPECQASCVLITVLVAEVLRQSSTDFNAELERSQSVESQLIDSSILSTEERQIHDGALRDERSDMIILENIKVILHFAVDRALRTLELAHQDFFDTKYQEGQQISQQKI